MLVKEQGADRYVALVKCIHKHTYEHSNTVTNKVVIVLKLPPSIVETRRMKIGTTIIIVEINNNINNINNRLL